MWVKICGNTNLEDAQLAAELGADAVGFVFAPSVRQVTPSQVARITPYLPQSLERVGVFPAWPWQQIAATVREAGLTTVQLHSSLDLDLMQALEKNFEGALRIIQTVHWTVGADHPTDIASAVREQLHQLGNHTTALDRVLIDSKVGAATGGTGTPFDWEAARSVFASENDENKDFKLILAGGLNPKNVAGAISQLQPWGVDVSSGVEASAGRKDPKKVAAFIQEARALRK